LITLADNVLRTELDMPNCLSRIAYKALSSQCQENASIMPLKQRCAQPILKIADAAAHGRFLDAKSRCRLAKTPCSAAARK
jgi:hypothetical protein